jgi:dihydrofolate synthase/folylpolyglutamate synthase
LPLSQQAVREGLLKVEIPGRFQVLPGRPTTVLDVAHNPHAAAVLAENLDRMGFYPVTHAVFGMLRDKDIAGVIKALGARIDHWHVANTPGPRGAEAEDVAALLRKSSGIGEASIKVHASITDAYATAESEAGADDRILAFGSFLTVAEVMRARSAARAGVHD